MLVFPMIAASLVAWATTADATPTLGRAAPRLAKRPPAAAPKVHVRGKRKPRGHALGVAARQTMTRNAAAPREPLPALIPVALATGDGTACPPDMVPIGSAFCIDVYEASLVEVMPDGDERPWPFYEALRSDVVVRAVSLGGVYPQGYVSGEQARDACERSGKRLCKPDEWRTACMGPNGTTFPYGNVREVGRCNDNGRSSMHFFNPGLDDKPEHRWMWGHGGNMVDPRLNQLDGTLTLTGERAGCTNDFGVYDMVGNLHEWVDDPNGTFQGGYYLDTHLNGDGCYYRTTAHPISHLDYSTGFRCCADEPGR